MNTQNRAQILVEALPYIQKYRGKVLVIKYGGNAMINEELKQAIIQDVVLLNMVGVQVVLVHGGGPEISKLLNQVGKESKFINGLRYTDEQTIDFVQMALCGKVNKDLVSLLEKAGGRAVGLSGLDASIFKALRHTDIYRTDYGYVGDIIKVDATLVRQLLDEGYIPVISSLARGYDEDVNYNVNADLAAEKIAIALKAEKFILLTDVSGVMEDVNDPDSLIPSIQVSQVSALEKKGIISGGMIPKVQCCVEAVRQGIRFANIQDGRIPHSILIELLSDQGVGTVFY
ncbi:acetylglutamate kinase [Faecalicoccus acidiformans]|uniref:Acetylglutamate kinase n=1 Tax=Faecalicoccus acidiformans TaxID=915173 RepID=A0A7W8FYA2_9FIRM|nr:acetylglutamate kinase [Faecalicoccus acidiformans]MBB5184555.1 acetylglutamate kinase [Faecalicoccus acidiformans]MBM6831623.1 acetylglutamate kinase [Faecalicoccus acidiformans]MDM8203985.1 acetylglutamate kinase [Faecalicoccus acidiformans]HIW17601.1 acetylglutamate kinase [Candidatus Faecalicoccus intestinipullorum]